MKSLDDEEEEDDEFDEEGDESEQDYEVNKDFVVDETKRSESKKNDELIKGKRSSLSQGRLKRLRD